MLITGASFKHGNKQWLLILEISELYDKSSHLHLLLKDIQNNLDDCGPEQCCEDYQRSPLQDAIKLSLA